MLTGKQLQAMYRAIEEGQKAGLEIPYAQIEATLAQHYTELLAEAAKGNATDEDIEAIVRWHWPDVLLDEWQKTLIRQILSGLETNLNEVLIKGCTKAGKGFAVATAACLWYQHAPRCKVIITSQRHKHAQDVMYAEVLRCRKRMKHKCDAEEGVQRIISHEQKYVAVASPESNEGFAGQHGPATLFLFDEATSVAEEYWDISKTQAALMVALANPRTMSGWFRNSFPSHEPDKTQEVEIPGGRRFLLTIGGADTLNVKTGEAKIANQITRDRYLAIKAHPNPRWSRVFGDGMFPEEDEDVLVIAPSWLRRHQDAWRDDLHVTSFGLDVAASESGDRTELSAGGPGGCKAIHELKDVDTMRVVAWVLRTAETKYGIDLRDGAAPIVVDMDGLGKGVGDRLAELDCWVIEFRGNAISGVDPKQYANLRTEAYGELGRRLDPRGAWPDEPWALPRDSELAEDLTAPERVYTSDGVKFRLTPKDKPTSSYKGETIKQKLGRSPDKGDSVAYLYHGVREYQTHINWAERDSDIIASGQNPTEERRPLDDVDMQQLPDYLRDLVMASRESLAERREWDQDQR